MQNRVIVGAVLCLVGIILVLVSFASIFQGNRVFTGKVISEGSEIKCEDSDNGDVTEKYGRVLISYPDGREETFRDDCDGSATVEYSCNAFASGSEDAVIKRVYQNSECDCLNGECIARKKICEEKSCNPENIGQICVKGQWESCTDGEVCSLGKCASPLNVNPTIITKGEGSSYSPSSDTAATPAASPAVQETSVSIGEIDGSSTLDIAKNEKLVFTINGTAHSIKADSIDGASVSLNADNKISFSISIGEEKNIDFDGDGRDDISALLKSINIITKKAKILLNEK